jgi:hypothetical protein
MSDTPRTDAASIRCACSTYVVPSEFARELERENAALREVFKSKIMDLQQLSEEAVILRVKNAALRKDKERMDWLETESGSKWAHHESEQCNITRRAIDAAIKEAQP